MKRRILSIITALALCLGMCPPLALAAGDVASVEINGTTTQYADFTTAWNAANSGQPAVLNLLGDVDMGTGSLNVKQGSNIELRGGSYKITSGAKITMDISGTFTLASGTVENTYNSVNAEAMRLESGSAAFIKGGTVTASVGTAVYSLGGSLTVDGGNISGDYRAIYAYVAGAKVTVNGGEMSSQKVVIDMNSGATLTMTGGKVSGQGYGLYVTSGRASEKSTVTLSGGEIYGKTASIMLQDVSGQMKLASFLADGCAYYNGSGNLIDYPDNEVFIKFSICKIGPCDHSSVNVNKNETDHWNICRGCKKVLPAEPHSFTVITDLGDGNHQISCACGQIQETAPHSFGEWTHETDRHVRTCTVCGAQESGEHSFANWTDNGSGGHTSSCTVCGMAASSEHSFSAWSDTGDGANHTRTCGVCGGTETEAHSGWTWTRLNDTTHQRRCQTCGASEQEEHQVSGYQQCDGTKHYITCAVCGERAAQAEHRFPESWTPGTDDHTRTCLDCGYTEHESHTQGGLQKDENGHFHVCTVCGQETDRAAHSYSSWKTEGAENHSHVCSVCQYKQTEPHIWDSDMRCTICRHSEGTVATVSIPGKEDQIFTEFLPAWEYANSNSSEDAPATLRLMINTSVTNELKVESGRNIILEMNENITLTSNENPDAISVYGIFTLNSGTVQQNSANRLGICVYGGGKAFFHGGTVRGDSYALFVEANTQVSITGGSFFGKTTIKGVWGSPSISGGTFTSTGDNVKTVFYSSNVSSNIAKGYLVYDENNNRVKSLNDMSLSGGPYTVRPCEQHSFQLEHLDGATHGQRCTLCKMTKDIEPCVFTGELTHVAGTNTHGQRCTVCNAFSNIQSCVFTGELTHVAGTYTHGQRCTICNEVSNIRPCDFSSGACACGAKPLVQVEKDGGTSYYGTFEDAWNAANGSTATITLLASTTVKKTYKIISGTDITLKMNDGVVYTNDISYHCFQVEGGSLTLASGTVELSAYGKYVVNAQSGKLRVTGGTYQNSIGKGIFVKDGVDVQLSGGTVFALYDPALKYEGHSVKEMLAPGCSIWKEDGTFVSGLDQEALDEGTYTVKKCPHAYEYTHTTGTTSHTETCPACGDVKADEPCSYDAATGKCACGSTLAVTLDGAEGLVYTGAEHKPAVTVRLDGTALAAGNYGVTYANNNPILERYIHSIFKKQVIDYNTAKRLEEPSADYLHVENEFVCFHTGLYTRRYKAVYGCFDRNKRKDSLLDWYFRGFADELAPCLKYVNPLPKKPHYDMAQYGVNYNPEWPIRVNTDHILGDPENLSRLPEAARSAKNLPLLLETAVELARRWAVVDPSIVAPQGYQGRVQYLLPICLTDMETPDLAMTLTVMDGYYLGNTCLTLEMAYLNARLLARPAAAWLTDLVM